MSGRTPQEEGAGRPAASLLLDISSMIRLERALWVAAELGVADHVPASGEGGARSGDRDGATRGDGSKGGDGGATVSEEGLAGEAIAVEEIASQVGADADALHRVLRGLASAGIFAEVAPRTFAHTPLSLPLRTDAPDSVRAVIAQHGGEGEWSAWGAVLHTVRTGDAAYAHVWGESPWRLYEETRGRMTQMSRRDSSAFASHPLFSGATHVVDVAGGEGDFLAAVLQANPSARGTLFDRPPIVASAPALLEEAGVGDRCAVEGGDMFEAVPAGGDLYLLKRTLHDWGDAEARALLGSIAAAMDGRGRLVILTRVLPPLGVSSSAALSDLTLMVMLGGRHRTEEELRGLIEAVGLRIAQVVELPSALSAVECVAG